MFNPLISHRTGNRCIICALPALFLQTTSVYAVDEPNSVAKPDASVAAPLLSPEEFKREENWRASIGAVPKPKKGCFTAKFPSKEWQEVPCGPTPDYPMPPRGNVDPEVIGNGSDVAAMAPTGFIYSATGSFDSLSSVTSESGQIAASGPAVADAYTLQINTDFFPTSVCHDLGSTSPDCRGWEQFVFENNNVSHRAYIQYWLYKFNTTCPSGWSQLSSPPDIYCVILSNSTGAVNTPAVPAINLGQVSLTGTAESSGDSITVTIAGTAYSRSGDNSVKASEGWQIAEFNVVGDGGNNVGVGSQAAFNSGASIVTRTRIIYGGTAPPTCVAQGFTAETNNLSFGPTAPGATSPGPAVIFTESTAGGSLTNCAAATVIGDTHLTTLSGLLYDFQASGDFDMLQTGSGFVVQNRQVSGAPTWPNASVTSGVAARLGKDEVAICLQPKGIFVDSKPLSLTPGKAFVTGEGTVIIQRGDTYTVRGPSGDWIRAGLNPGYIDVRVGVGRWPIEAKGLLVNVKGEKDLLATREGEILHNPFSFEELYSRYAESWRVPSKSSMLDVCRRIEEVSVPRRPFFAADLEPGLASKVKTVCNRHGVKEGPLLEACMIDVAVIGTDKAADVYTKMPRPPAVGQVK